jgi:hypothetical protein
MKTPTLIVRLVGLLLLAYCANLLLGIRQAEQATMGLSLPPMQQQMFTQLRINAWFGVVVGTGAVLFAGRLARLLTMDSA